MSLIKVSNLKKYFVDRLILNIDNLEIQNGDKVGLVGANGCGKTTLLNILCGRESYDEGQIHMESSFSYINQFDEEVEISSSRLSKELNLPFCYNDYLSGGEKVRVALSMVILSDNNLLILDEPTNYLDIPSMEVLEEAISYTNKTMIIVSHDRRFISKVCDEVLIIKDKRLIHYPYSYEEWINKSKEVKISKDKREKEERLMIIRNKITEIISLMSIEKDEAKISKYEKSYEELLRELKTLQS